MLIDFGTAFRWLNQFDSSCLRTASRELALQLDSGLRRVNRSEINRLSGLLLSIATQGRQTCELAEAYTLCARAAYRLNELDRSAAYLEEAQRLYEGLLHQAGVVAWLRGCVLWGMTSPERYQQALVVWQSSMDRFERLLAAASVDEPWRYHWYRSILDEMRATLSTHTSSLALRTAVLLAPPPGERVRRSPPGPPEETEPPAPPDVHAGTWTQEFPTPESAPARFEVSIPVTPAAGEEATAEPLPVRLQTFTISDLIPAGGFGPLGTDPHPIGYVQIDRLIINDQPYRIVPLKRNGSVINLSGFLSSGRLFTVLRVNGDSMNRADIADGDYVLVLLQNNARDGDIVVAGLQEEEAQATLKRFRRRGAVVDLVPESTNPEHPIRTFSADQIELHISGVALAALKPVEEP